MTMSWIAASLFAVVLIAPSFAFAWGAKGHQIVAYLNISKALLLLTVDRSVEQYVMDNATTPDPSNRSIDDALIDVSESDAPIYRIFSLWFLEEALRLRQLVLVSPDMWEDPFEVNGNAIAVNRRGQGYHGADITEQHNAVK